LNFDSNYNPATANQRYENALSFTSNSLVDSKPFNSQSAIPHGWPTS